MKKKLLTGLLVVFGLYALLVLLHWLYLELGGRSHPRTVGWGEMAEMKSLRMASVELPVAQRNFATAKFALGAPDAFIEQKYEKVGDVTAATARFDTDLAIARTTFQRHNTIVQAETVRRHDSLQGVNFTLGVPPAGFDPLLADLKQIGQLVSFDITKADRTDDYRRLQAERTTLEKTRDSLTALKSQGGKIEELIRLEKEIFELEGKIQTLGVQLGQYDKANDLCTIRFSLTEKHEVPEPGTDHLGYFIRSLEWASGTALYLAGLAFVTLLGTLLLVVVMEKISRLNRTPA